MEVEWKFPLGAERDYEQILRRMASSIHSIAKTEILKRYDGWIFEMSRLDYYGDVEYVMQLIEQEAKEKEREAEAQLLTIFLLISSFNQKQFARQVKSGTGIEIPKVSSAKLSKESILSPASNNWIAQNSRLIKSLSSEQQKAIELIVRNGLMQGVNESAIASDIQKSLSVTKNRATLIASDQVSKANSMLTKIRLQEVGVSDYYWMTKKDNRVRLEHKERDGKIFNFDNPPPDGNPGHPIRCRCWAKPKWDSYEIKI